MNAVSETREKIINGLQELQNACKDIPVEQCHKQCPYEDICLMLRCVGWGTGVKIFPCNWKLDRLRKENKHENFK